MVPVPSIFFIKNGIPIKVIAGNVKSVEELHEVIDGVRTSESSLLQQQQHNSATAASPSAETSGSMPSPSLSEKNETEEEKQEKIKKAMKLIEQKRIERIQEEQRLEKEKEIQRRKEGQEIINLKKWQEDQELKQIKEDQLREKNEAKAARQRVLDQIEQDKKERALRFSMQQGSNDPKLPTPVSSTVPPPVSSDSARIQFKKVIMMVS